MYAPIKDGSSEKIQGLKCHIPAKGMLFNPFALGGKGRWEHFGVWARSTVVKYCYWEPDPRWELCEGWQKEEDEKRIGNEKYRHPELQKFKKEMWIYRTSGFWFRNNGRPTYLTGHHWYYLSCYKRDDVKMDYRESDRQIFYFWQYASEDPNCLGIIETTMRRQGKTSRTGCVALDLASRIPNFRVGIQSKTDEDAEVTVFKEAIVEPYRALPNVDEFFRPVTDVGPSGRIPKEGMKFTTGKIRGDSPELNSRIDYKSSAEKGYDGKKLNFYIGDEEGKVPHQNVYLRWKIVEMCLKDRNRKVIGKAWHTSTVEEMESGGAEYFDLWKESNQHDGMPTPSGLYRFFLPADLARNPNHYGFVDRKKNMQDIMAERARQTNPLAKASMMRKEPLTEDEAFLIDGTKCWFNPLSLAERLHTLRGMIRPRYQVGNFAWVNGIVDGDVEFIINANGRWKIVSHPLKANNYIENNGIFRPLNNHIYSAGIDPYDHRTVEKSTERSKSSGSACIKKEATPASPDSLVEGNVCALYLARPSPEVFSEDMIMALKYYGCDALIENKNITLLNTMQDRGYKAYSYWIKGRLAPGIPASAEQTNYMTTLTEQFIDQHINNVFFPELVEDWINFDPEKTTKYDAAMAFGYCETRSKMKASGGIVRSRRGGMDVGKIFGIGEGGGTGGANYQLQEELYTYAAKT